MKYEDSNRGIIQNRERKRQIIDYSGLRYGKITPTDLDGFIEYHNELFALYEYKYKKERGMSAGQYKALVRVIDAVQRGGLEAALFLVKHDQEDPEKDIDGANSIVDRYYYKGKWSYNVNRTAKEVTDSFMNYVENK